MTPEVSQIILTEVRELRAIVTEGFKEHGQRITKVEENVKFVIGNGKAGLIDKQDDKIAELAKDVADLKETRVRLVTAKTIVFSIASTLGGLAIAYGDKVLTFLGTLLA
jgi:hypothetical protein